MEIHIKLSNKDLTDDTTYKLIGLIKELNVKEQEVEKQEVKEQEVEKQEVKEQEVEKQEVEEQETKEQEVKEQKTENVINDNELNTLKFKAKDLFVEIAKRDTEKAKTILRSYNMDKYNSLIEKFGNDKSEWETFKTILSDTKALIDAQDRVYKFYKEELDKCSEGVHKYLEILELYTYDDCVKRFGTYVNKWYSFMENLFKDELL